MITVHRRVLDRGVGGPGQRRADRRLHRQLLRQRHDRAMRRSAQDAMQYEGMARSSVTDTNGAPPLLTNGHRARGAGGAAARGADLRSGQWPDAVRQRRVHRRRGPGQGRLARQLGQHLRAGARQRDHRQAAVAGRHPLRRHPQPRADAGADPAELRRRRRREVLPAVRRQRRCPACRRPTSCSRPASTTATATCSPSRPSSASIRTRRSPANIPISGMRIGVNGALAPGGPDVRHLNATVGGAELHRRQRPAAVERGHGGAGRRSGRPTTCSS